MNKLDIIVRKSRRQFHSFARCHSRCPVRFHDAGLGMPKSTLHNMSDSSALIGHIWGMTHFARRAPIRLRVLQANGDLARRKVPASVTVILLALAGDVDGFGSFGPAGPLSLADRQPAARPDTVTPRKA
jgi:hypothetical protein